MQSILRQATTNWGVRLGILLGLAALIPTTLTFAGTSLSVINAATDVVTVLGLCVFILSGILTTWATGEVSQGAIAGLLAGCVFALVSGLGGIALALFDAPAYGLLLFAGQPSLGPGALIVLSIIRMLTVLLLFGGIGAGLGGLGGLLSRLRAGGRG